MSAWPTDKAVEAKAMWLDGKSAGIIARALGVSRNAVVGKMSRMRLARAPNVARTGLRRPGRPRTAKPKPPVGEPIWVTIIKLERGMCRYPRDGAKGVEYCAAPADGSWCPLHRARVFTSPADAARPRVGRASCSRA